MRLSILKVHSTLSHKPLLRLGFNCRSIEGLYWMVFPLSDIIRFGRPLLATNSCVLFTSNTVNWWSRGNSIDWVVGGVRDCDILQSASASDQPTLISKRQNCDLHVEYLESSTSEIWATFTQTASALHSAIQCQKSSCSASWTLKQLSVHLQSHKINNWFHCNHLAWLSLLCQSPWRFQLIQVTNEFSICISPSGSICFCLVFLWSHPHNLVALPWLYLTSAYRRHVEPLLVHQTTMSSSGTLTYSDLVRVHLLDSTLLHGVSICTLGLFSLWFPNNIQAIPREGLTSKLPPLCPPV